MKRAYLFRSDLRLDQPLLIGLLEEGSPSPLWFFGLDYALAHCKKHELQPSPLPHETGGRADWVDLTPTEWALAELALRQMR